MTRKTPKNKRKALRYGYRAEYLALWFFVLKGYHIIQRDYRSTYGQVDLILYKKETLIFVEVKARKNTAAWDIALSFPQRKRIEYSALAFIKAHPRFQSCTLRFDALFFSPWRFPLHIKNAW